MIFKNLSRIALGTAQFGLDYGISNSSGKVKKKETVSLIKLAKDYNINTLDTAKVYGESEKILGELDVAHFNIITKLPPIPKDIRNMRLFVNNSIKDSLKKLKTSKVYGLLLHKSSDLLEANGNELFQAISDLKSKGIVKKIGISIYDPAELEKIFSTFKIDIIQIPINIIDRRMYNTGWLKKLYEANIEIHARSIFLQGLLLLPKKKIPAKFKRWSNLTDKWHFKLEEKKNSALQICLSFIFSMPYIKYIILGVENTNHLKNIISTKLVKINNKDWQFIECDDENLINPSNWKKL